MNVDDAVIVALGSNQALGAAGPQELLEAALARFPALGLEVVKRSRWWRSKAWPDETQPEFLNGVAWVETALSPKAVMAALHGLEDEFGRVRGEANAPRTLDLDLIAYGRTVMRQGPYEPSPPSRGRGQGEGGANSQSPGSQQAPPPLTPPREGEGDSRNAGDAAALILPHPRAHERLFVMGPLAEIAPDWRHPVLGRSAKALAGVADVGADAHPGA
jgi:2-amino-4-hydroxy-6-hydroxymethyldihydropteridine diphosphokinase